MSYVNMLVNIGAKIESGGAIEKNIKKGQKTKR